MAPHLARAPRRAPKILLTTLVLPQGALIFMISKHKLGGNSIITLHYDPLGRSVLPKNQTTYGMAALWVPALTTSGFLVANTPWPGVDGAEGENGVATWFRTLNQIGILGHLLTCIGMHTKLWIRSLGMA